MRPWITLFAVLLATQAKADDTIFGPTRNGVQIVCADINDLHGMSGDMVATWILGFWSGLNAAKSARVGDGRTASGVVGEVKLYCSTHPSVSLAQATLDTYVAMRSAQEK